MLYISSHDESFENGSYEYKKVKFFWKFFCIFKVDILTFEQTFIDDGKRPFLCYNKHN